MSTELLHLWRELLELINILRLSLRSKRGQWIRDLGRRFEATDCIDFVGRCTQSSFFEDELAGKLGRTFDRARIRVFLELLFRSFIQNNFGETVHRIVVLL